MDAASIVAHLGRCYQDGSFTDVLLRLSSGACFRVHKVVLSQSGYFNALMSRAWEAERGSSQAFSVASSPLPSPRALEFDIEVDDADAEETAQGMEAAIKFLYGQMPTLTQDNVRALLVCGSFFDIPPLCGLVSDYVFSNLSYDNVVAYLMMVHGREYGEPGKLVEDASFAFLYRNAVDIGPAALAVLPLPFHKRLLTAAELYAPSEFARYRLAVEMKARARDAILRDQAAERAAAAEAARRAAAARRRRVVRAKRLAGLPRLHAVGGSSSSDAAAGHHHTASAHGVQLQLESPAVVRRRAWGLSTASGGSGSGSGGSGAGSRTAMSSGGVFVGAPAGTALSTAAAGGGTGVGGTIVGTGESPPYPRAPPPTPLLSSSNGALAGVGTRESAGGGPPSRSNRVRLALQLPSISGASPRRSANAAAVAGAALLVDVRDAEGNRRAAGGGGGDGGAPTAVSHNGAGGGAAGGGLTVASALRVARGSSFAPGRGSGESAAGAGVGGSGSGGTGGGGGPLSPPIWTTSVSSPPSLTRSAASEAGGAAGSGAGTHGPRISVGSQVSGGGVPAPLPSVTGSRPHPLASPSSSSASGAAIADIDMTEAEVEDAAPVQTARDLTGENSGSGSGSHRGGIPASFFAPAAVGAPPVSSRIATAAGSSSTLLSSTGTGSLTLAQATASTASHRGSGGTVGLSGNSGGGSGSTRMETDDEEGGGGSGDKDGVGDLPSTAYNGQLAMLASRSRAGREPFSPLASTSSGGGGSGGTAVRFAPMRARNNALGGSGGGRVDAPPPPPPPFPGFGPPPSSFTAAPSSAASSTPFYQAFASAAPSVLGGVSAFPSATSAEGAAAVAAAAPGGGTAAYRVGLVPAAQHLPPPVLPASGHSVLDPGGRSSASSLPSAHFMRPQVGVVGGVPLPLPASSAEGGGDFGGLYQYAPAQTAATAAAAMAAASASVAAASGGSSSSYAAPPPPPPGAGMVVRRPRTSTGSFNGGSGGGGTSALGITPAAATATTTIESDASAGDAPPRLESSSSSMSSAGGDDAMEDGGEDGGGLGVVDEEDEEMDSSEGGGGTPPLPPPSRDYEGELAALDAAYDEVFSSLRLVHLSPEQLAAVAAEGEVSPALVETARAEAAAVAAKLAVAAKYNVTRLSELDARPEHDAAAVRDVKWPPFRFGVEVSGVFSEGMTPGPEGAAQSMSSDRVFFAGSLWCLDLKRYVEDGAESVAVYLRRRSMRNFVPPAGVLAATVGVRPPGGVAAPPPAAAPAFNGAIAATPAGSPPAPALFEDTRDRTTMGFSIRLCGAPGAPTSNSVCGRSVMGKAFGTEESSSWGWMSFASAANLTEKPWSTGDRLRFVINLDML